VDRKDIHELLNDPELLRRYVQQSGYTSDPVQQGHQQATPGGEWITPAQPVRPTPPTPAQQPPANDLVEVRFEISGQAWFEQGAFVGQSWEIIRDKVRQVVYEPDPGAGYRWWLPMVNSDITRIWTPDGAPPIARTTPAQQMAPPPAPDRPPLPSSTLDAAALGGMVADMAHELTAFVSEQISEMKKEIQSLRLERSALDRMGEMLREAQGYEVEGDPIDVPVTRKKPRKPRNDHVVDPAAHLVTVAQE
jgi:hypothetical protein